MTANGILQILFFFLLVLLVTRPLGHFMARVFEGEKTLLDPVFKPIERALYKLCGIDEKQDMKWTTYAFAMLMFSVVGIVVTYALLRLQGSINFAGLNPERLLRQRHHARPEFQYGGLVRHQHELAELLARTHDELFLQHGRAWRFITGCRRRRALPLPLRWCAGSPAARRRASATSG